MSGETQKVRNQGRNKLSDATVMYRLWYYSEEVKD
jgi:hypothetical protein